jgi:hypothetical protein
MPSRRLPTVTWEVILPEAGSTLNTNDLSLAQVPMIRLVEGCQRALEMLQPTCQRAVSLSGLRIELQHDVAC